MNQACVAALARLIELGPRPLDIFEWGSGGSTIWFAEKAVGRVVSVEHDAAWQPRVIQAAIERGLNVDFILRLPVPSPGCQHSFGHPWSKPGMDFSAYINAIEGMFDLILVDGRARNLCFANAISHLRPGGRLLLHDSERRCYRPSYDAAVRAGLACDEVAEGRRLLICSMKHGHSD